jgi:hypothetical protein
MGGSRETDVNADDNLVWLCRDCHRNIHEGVWMLEHSAEGVAVTEKNTGVIVMRRLHSPDFDVPAFFQTLNIAENTLSSLFEFLVYLSDEQLVEAFGYCRSLSKRSWLIQAAILYEAQQRSTYSEQALEGIARRFEISLRHAQKYALIWKLFFAPNQGNGENVNVDAILLDEPSWYIIAATESPDPQRWLAYAQDRKVQDPRYTVTAFRREIHASRIMDGFKDVFEIDGDLPEDGHHRWKQWQQCPWIRLYCIHSGRPVPVGEACDNCEFSNGGKTSILRNEPTAEEEAEDVGIL